jgi:hypothetical protein
MHERGMFAYMGGCLKKFWVILEFWLGKWEGKFGYLFFQIL